MESRPLSPNQKKSSSRIAELRRRIARIDLICSGTVLERTKVCGKPNCRCARDPDAEHGPYYEWKRRENNRLRHRIVSAEEAERIRKAQDDYQCNPSLCPEF